MKTAVLTLTESSNYKIDFFDGGKLFDVHVWKDRTKIRDVLKASGLQLGRSPRTQWWPREVGERREFVIEQPANWFWTLN